MRNKLKTAKLILYLKPQGIVGTLKTFLWVITHILWHLENSSEACKCVKESSVVNILTTIQNCN